MGKLKPRIVSVALLPDGVEYPVDHDRSQGKVFICLAGVRFGKIRLHKTKVCAGEFCCIHNPSDHPLKDAPMILRMDRGALIERVCEHGTGHPDPDSVAFYRENGWVVDGVHGCCGCC
jgi:hypothetical protein